MESGLAVPTPGTGHRDEVSTQGPATPGGHMSSWDTPCKPMALTCKVG